MGFSSESVHDVRQLPVLRCESFWDSKDMNGPLLRPMDYPQFEQHRRWVARARQLRQELIAKHFDNES
jgi:hypothetical protein